MKLTFTREMGFFPHAIRSARDLSRTGQLVPGITVIVPCTTDGAGSKAGESIGHHGRGTTV